MVLFFIRNEETPVRFRHWAPIYVDLAKGKRTELSSGLVKIPWVIGRPYPKVSFVGKPIPTVSTIYARIS